MNARQHRQFGAMRRLLLSALLCGCADAAAPDLATTRAALSAAEPDDPYFADQWQLGHDGPFTTRDGKGKIVGSDHAHVAEAWGLILRLGLADTLADIGRDVRLAIVDDGFDLLHEELAAKYVASRNFGEAVEPGNLFSNAPANFHGTLVTGIAAAAADDGKGIAGVCPGCRLIAARISGAGSPDGEEPADYHARVFDWVLAQEPHVLNLSFGPDANADRTTLEGAIARLTERGRSGRGTVVVAAAGNSGEDFGWNAFADSERTLAVGGTDSTGTRYDFSNYGAGLDLMAPTSGGEKQSAGLGSLYIDRIWTTDNYLAPACLRPGQTPSSGCSDGAGWTPQRSMAGGDGWVGKYSYRFSHTSAAAPFASGVVGLVLHVAPELSHAEVIRLLRASADRVQPGDAGYDPNGFSERYGYGRINALRAVALAYLAVGGTISSDLRADIDALSPCTRADCWEGAEAPTPVEPDAGVSEPDPDGSAGDDGSTDGSSDTGRDGASDGDGDGERDDGAAGGDGTTNADGATNGDGETGEVGDDDVSVTTSRSSGCATLPGSPAPASWSLLGLLALARLWTLRRRVATRRA